MSSNRFLAMLVAIKDYPNIKPLRGPLNDVETMSNLLDELSLRFQRTLLLRTLVNEEAKRQSLITTFQGFFSQLKSGDTGIFYFCGHGSRMKAPPELEEDTPDGFMETLVCYDSRQGDNWDLIDKELGFLIWQMTHIKKCHFLVILDCCHSGSGTKQSDAMARRMADTPRIKPLKEFLGSPLAKMENGKAGFPIVQHLLIAACRKNEYAWERMLDGKFQGLLTYTLSKVLRNNRHLCTYPQLLDGLQSTIQNIVNDQHPQLEVVGKATTQVQIFTGLPSRDGLAFLLYFHDLKGWLLSAGAIHGLESGKDPIQVWLQPLDEKEIPRQEEDGHIHDLHLMSIHAKWSTVSPLTAKKLNRDQKYLVVFPSTHILSISLATTTYIDTFVRQWQAYLHKRKKYPWKVQLPMVQWMENTEETTYHLNISPNEYQLFDGQKNDLCYWREFQTAEQAFGFLFSDLEKIASWHRLLTLGKSTDPLDINGISISFHSHNLSVYASPLLDKPKAHAKFCDSPPALHYDKEGQRWISPAFSLSIEHKGISDKSLWVGMLHLGADFSIDQSLLPPTELKPKEMIHARHLAEDYPYESRLIPLNVPRQYIHKGIYRIKEHFKIFISEMEFDFTRLLQPGISIGELIKKSDGKAACIQLKEAKWKCVDFSIDVEVPQAALSNIIH